MLEKNSLTHVAYHIILGW